MLQEQVVAIILRHPFKDHVPRVQKADVAPEVIDGVGDLSQSVLGHRVERHGQDVEATALKRARVGRDLEQGRGT